METQHHPCPPSLAKELCFVFKLLKDHFSWPTWGQWFVLRTARTAVSQRASTLPMKTTPIETKSPRKRRPPPWRAERQLLNHIDRTPVTKATRRSEGKLTEGRPLTDKCYRVTKIVQQLFGAAAGH
jgi:hypothetical protein